MRGFHARQDFAGIHAQDAPQQSRRASLVGDLRRYREDGVHHHRHGQLAAVAVVDDAPPRRNLDGALLLALRPLREVAVAEHLQVDQAQPDRARPQNKDQAQSIKTPGAVPR